MNYIFGASSRLEQRCFHQMVEENQPLGQVLVNPDPLQPPCSYHCHFSGGRLGGFLHWATAGACFIAQFKHHGAEERGVVSWVFGIFLWHFFTILNV